MFKRIVKRVKDVVSLYDDLWYYSLVKNESKYCGAYETKQDFVAVDFLGSYHGDNITFYYLFQSLPRELSINFKDRIRSECFPGVKVNFLNNMKGHNINWSSPAMQNRLRVLRQVSKDTSNSNIDAFNLHENISSLTKQDWIEESLKYLAIAYKKRGRATLETSMLMIITGKRGDEFDASVLAIERLCKDIGIDLDRVLYEVPDFMRACSPFSKKDIKSINKFLPIQVMTDEIIARYSNYAQGKLGRRGICFGLDVESKFPILKQVKKEFDTAENWVIVGETGSGKSFFVKFLLEQLMALNLYGTINDIEGLEYMPHANFVSHNSKVQIVNMSEGIGNYYDPVEVCEAIGVKEVDEDRMNLSINYTTAIMKTLLGTAYGKNEWLGVVLDDAITATYISRQVIFDDESTWDNSKGLTLRDVYFSLRGLRGVGKDSEEYQTAIAEAVALIGRYFEDNGSKRYVFKNRITAKDISDSRLLVCSFGMASRSPDLIDPIQLGLMQLSAAQISYQRSLYARSRGVCNYKIWEEINRWGKFPDSEKTLGVAITGGRKIGDINIAITNMPKDLLDDDKFGLFNNSTSYCIGAIPDSETRERLCDRLSVPQFKDDLTKIAKSSLETDEDKNKDVDPMDVPYAQAFLCLLDKSIFGVAKAIVPKSIRESKLFQSSYKKILEKED